jgi:hypothetical protein
VSGMKTEAMRMMKKKKMMMKITMKKALTDGINQFNDFICTLAKIIP